MTPQTFYIIIGIINLIFITFLTISIPFIIKKIYRDHQKQCDMLTSIIHYLLRYGVPEAKDILHKEEIEQSSTDTRTLDEIVEETYMKR